MIPLFLLSLANARAEYTVVLDFDTAAFDLAPLNAAFHCTDQPSVEDMIVYMVQRDYASFDVTVTTVSPASGPFLTMVIGGDHADAKILGEASPLTDFGVNDSERIGAWELQVNPSLARVYTDNILDDEQYGFNYPESCPRVARAVAQVTSHEAGHIFGLNHAFAYDDCPLPEVPGDDVDHCDHIMDSTDTPNFCGGASIQPGFDEYFSNPCASRYLHETVRGRSYFASLPDVSGTSRADLVLADVTDLDTVPWTEYPGGTSGFGSGINLASDLGSSSDFRLFGNVEGDGRAELIRGLIESDGDVAWYAYDLSAGSTSALGQYAAGSGSFGVVGDRFRLGDVTGDGLDDLVIAHSNASNILTWKVCPATGIAFGTCLGTTTGGAWSDASWIEDIDGDGDDDLLIGDMKRSWSALTEWVEWRYHPSNGLTFSTSAITLSASLGRPRDGLLVTDVNLDGQAELLIGDATDDTIEWKCYYPTTFNTWGYSGLMSADGGDRGDLFRAADVDGDGRGDLLWAHESYSGTTWHRRLSSGCMNNGFSTPSQIFAGPGEGGIYP